MHHIAAISVCSVATCVRPANRCGFCEAHYKRHSLGRPMDAPIEPRRKRGSPPDPLPRLAAEQPGAVKTCVKCKKAKVVSEFSLAKTCRDGRLGSCKECNRPRRQIAQKGYLKRHPNANRNAKAKRRSGLVIPRSPEAAAKVVARNAAVAMLRLGLKSCSVCEEVKDVSLFLQGKRNHRCDKCRRAYSALYYKMNRERTRKAHATHYARNADHHLARNAAWFKRNPGKRLEYQERYRQKNRLRYLDSARLRERQKRFWKRLGHLAILQHKILQGSLT